MIAEKHALDELIRLSKPGAWEDASPFCGLRKIGDWARFAQEAIQRGDTQAAKACIAVIERLVGQ